MKTIFSIVIVLHGLIHGLGFLKAFNLMKVEALSLPITKPIGMQWLLAGCLIMVYVLVDFLEIKNSWKLGLLAVVVSQILIFYFWKDAKFGTLINLAMLVNIFISYGNISFDKLIKKETTSILSTSNPVSKDLLSEKEITDLPPIIQKWLTRSGAVGQPKTQVGKLEQKVLMKLKPDQEKWYQGNAIQHTTINPPAFYWQVKVDMNKLMWFRGRDKFADGKGEMLIKLNSFIILVNEKEGNINEGALQRYLSEIVWFPSAAIQPYISWKQLDDYSAEATMTYQGVTGSAKFFFNENGDFERLEALRFKGNEPNAKRYPWLIQVNDYQIFEGIKVPSKCQVTWTLEEGDWTWLEMEVTNLQFDNNVLSY